MAYNHIFSVKLTVAFMYIPVTHINTHMHTQRIPKCPVNEMVKEILILPHRGLSHRPTTVNHKPKLQMKLSKFITKADGL